MRWWSFGAIFWAAVAGCGKCDSFDLVGDDEDQNCDGVDGVDADGDGFAAAGSGGTDCDDADGEVHPEADDHCNLVDDDCNGLVDDGSESTVYHRDADGDGFGLDGDTLASCAQPDGYVEDGGDCDDARAVVSPGRAEACNGWDDDCDGVIDGPGADGFETWHADADGDGFGDAESPLSGCRPPTAAVLDATDCDDLRPDVFPGAAERCDGLDQDCDGAVDDLAYDAPTWKVDADGDGYGDDATATLACDAPVGTIAAGGDCDDADDERHPSATETCNTVDDDCDGLTDDQDAFVDAPAWFSDADGDGHGDPTAASRACAQPGGAVADATDCDDGDATAFVGALEVPGDGIDQDCDGADPPDFDRDGFAFPEDCDDADPNLSPTATDIVGDAIDQNCDAVDGTDVDGDGVPSEQSGGDDCGDLDADVFPGAFERLTDGLWNSCEGEVDEVAVESLPDGFEGDPGDHLGGSVTAADFDGDGVPELVVGVPRHPFYGGANTAGGVRAFHAGPGVQLPSDAVGAVDSVDAGAGFGDVVTALPDLDGDGLPELAVGAQNANGGYGAVFLWFDPLPSSGSASTAAVQILGNSSQRGIQRVAAGDVTGDGVLDLVVAHGSYPGATVVAGPFAAGTIDLATDGVATISGSGGGLSDLTRLLVHDLDGDGVDDLVLAAWQAASSPGENRGRVSVFRGPISGALEFGADADATFTGADADYFGADVAVGDLDGDGALDLLVTSSDPGLDLRSSLYAFPADLLGVHTTADATARVDGTIGGPWFGYDLVAGDPDADGDLDVVLTSDDLVVALQGPIVGRVELSAVPHGFVRGRLAGQLGRRATAIVPDTDGDGVPDLFLGEQDAELSSSRGAATIVHSPW